MATINKRFVVKNGLASEEGAVDFFGANTVSLYDGNDAASIVLDASDGAITIGANTSTNWELPTARGTNGYFLKTNTNGVATWAAVPSGSFTISDGSVTDSFVNGETLTFTGGTGLTSTVSDNEVTFDLANTAVTAGDYGNTTSVPVITVDAQGRITSATTASISTSFDITDGTITDTFNNGDTLTFTGGSNITSTVSNNQVTFNLDNSISLSGGTASSNTTTGDVVTSGGVGVGGSLNVGGAADIGGDIVGGGTLNVSGNATIEGSSLTLGDASNTTASATISGPGTINIDPFESGANGIVVIKGDLQVDGTTTTVNSTEITIADKNLTLAANAANAAATDGAGITIDVANATFTYDQANDRWTANKDIATDLVGNASTATKLATARTIELTGDVTGSASFDGSANASIAVTISANSVALGTDTTGDYVASLVAGNGIQITAAVNGEGDTPTITNADRGSSQNIFKNVAADSGNTIVADSNDDTLTILGDGGLTTVASANTDTLVVHVSETVTFGSDTSPNAQNVSIRGYQEASISANTDFEVLTQTNAVGSKLVFGAVDTADATSRHMIEVMVMTDGSDTYLTQYGEVFTSAALFSLEGSLTTAGDVKIVPAAGKTIRIKVQEQAI